MSWCIDPSLFFPIDSLSDLLLGTKTLKSKSVDGKVLNEDEESQGEQDDDCSSSQLGEETESSKSDDQLSDNTDTDEEL